MAPGARLRWALVLGAPLAFGIWSLILGQDANWDLRNYHWYNPYALLTGRADIDAAPAGLQTFYSPLIDLAWFGLAQWLPGRAVGFVIGAVQSANFLLLYAVARVLLPIESPTERRMTALLVAATGVCGAGTVTEIGTTMNDAVVSVGVLSSLLLVLRPWPSLLFGPPRGALLRAALAGLPIGLALAGKLTTGTYVIGLAIGFLMSPCPFARRVALTGGFSAGAGAAAAVLLGPWLVHVWRQTGNPIFPYLNSVFHSPLASPESYWMIWMQPRGPTEALLFPLRFIGIGPRVMELSFVDYRIITAYAFVPLLLVLVVCLRAHRSPVPTSDGYLFFSMAVSYVCWLAAFSYYRYAVPLEMLAPLMIALAIWRLPVAPWLRRMATALVMIALLATGRAADYGRAPWRHHFVEVAVPALAQPELSVVLLLGQPSAFVVPSFPPSVRFFQLVPNFALSEDPTLPWHRLMQGWIDAHRGDFHAILLGPDASASRTRLAGYGLALVEAGCRPLATNLTLWQDESLRFCPVARRAGSGAVNPP